MRTLLMVLSVLAAWGLLGVLASALLLTMKSLQSIRGWFEKVTSGLRAVEQQTLPLGSRAEELAATLTAATAAMDAAAQRLRETDGLLAAAAPSLRGR